MPMHVKSMRTQEEFRRERKPGGSSRLWCVSLVFKLIVMAGLVCGAVNMRISYNQKAEQLTREAETARRNIYELDREIANLKKRREELSSYAYIVSCNDTYKLGLRPADPRQVRRISLIRYSRGGGSQLVSDASARPGIKTAKLGR